MNRRPGIRLFQAPYLLLIPPILALLLSAGYIISAPVLHYDYWDEAGYTKHAHQVAARGKKELLTQFVPGLMHYRWLPPLVYPIYGLLAVEDLQEHYAGTRTLSDEQVLSARAAFMFRCSWMNALLFTLTTLLLVQLTVTLGLGNGVALIGGLLYVLNPRQVFYVQAIWPEYQHLVLLLGGLLLLALGVQRKRTPLLIASSLLFAYASLLKGVSEQMFPVLVVGTCLAWGRQPHRSRLWAVLAFSLPFFLCIHAQKGTNLRQADHYAIAANRWHNMELALIPDEYYQERGHPHAPAMYHGTPGGWKTKEAGARERVLGYLRSTPLPVLLQRQALRWAEMLSGSNIPKWEKLNRWGDGRTYPLAHRLAGVFSWTLLIAGVTGALLSLRRLHLLWPVHLYTGYYLFALFFVFWRPRYLLQVLPFLCLFTAYALQRFVAFLNLRRSRGALCG